jgi:S-adenosylmethionine hydrolase
MIDAPVFLFSDFGTRDAYVGVMRAVIAGLAPAAPVHDLLHEVPPQDLVAARAQLAAVLPWLPDGAVLCAVVDPGVGTDRAGLIVRARDEAGRHATVVAPDNGLLGSLLRDERPPYRSPLRADAAWRIERHALPPRGAGTTFDGRDLFAPAAASLARGVPPADLGRPVDLGALVATPAPPLRPTPDGRAGRIVWIDRFGDLVSDVPAPPRYRVRIAGRELDGPAAGFATVPVGAPLSYVGSWGTVEVAVRDGSAAAAWRVDRGDAIEVVPLA